ncbi:PAS domain S-box-containing protein [Pseudomonas duriflava]|uniref:histidine kinase n=1 Tax=Pseudomonas duriflava TaxID=459528 RepID=A0A562Q8A7_9PSED|nr:ATP-binding protein [Pseudomonas duriflava]TWI52420.1 PAS domain S-box-containing protein [Pseudomonas duriflava]
MAIQNDHDASTDWLHLSQWMFEGSPDCVKLLDLDGRLRVVNRNGQCALEIDDISTVLGGAWCSFWPEESQSEVEASLVAARAGRVTRFSAFCPTAKGAPKWWDVTVAPVRSETGEVEAILSISRDVTALQVAKDEQRENAARLQFMLSAAQVGDWELDLVTGRARTSRLHDQCFGYSQPVDEWSLERFLASVHPDDRERLQRDYEQALATHGEWAFECRVVWPDRSVHWISALGSIYRSKKGQPDRMVGTVVDITSRKRAEAVALGQKKALELALAGAPLPAILDVLTRAAEEGAGETIMASVLLMDPATGCLRHGSAPSLPATYSSAIDGLSVGPAVGSCGTAAYRGEPVMVTDIAQDPLWKDFKTLALTHGLRSCWSQPILSPQGRVLGTLAVYRDHPWEPTAADRESMGLLLNTVALVLDRHQQLMERQQAEADLRALTEELTEANRRKTEFLATLAHELRNPLAPILSGLEVMKLASDDRATLGRVREMMERQAAHMTHLIDDLLDVARITKGKLLLRKERVTLQSIISTAIDTSLPLIEAGAHNLSVQVPEEPLLLDADPTRLAQVISNLLNNAAKYTPKGGCITLGVEQADDAVDITVIDNGIGLTAEALGTVFDMFAQVDQGSAQAQDGLGIGLTLVQRLVELHGGTVMATSPGLGGGSKFRVHIPTIDQKSTEVLPLRIHQPHIDEQRGGLRILVVDDNIDAAEVLSTLLEMSGHTLHMVHDGYQALEAVESFRPDVMFLDIGLPDLNGFEVAKALRLKPKLKDMAIIALTGWGAEQDRVQSKEVGFDYHLTKPANFQEIERLLSSLSPASPTTVSSF